MTTNIKFNFKSFTKKCLLNSNFFLYLLLIKYLDKKYKLQLNFKDLII